MTPAEIAGTVVSVLGAIGGGVVAVGRWLGAREDRRDAERSAQTARLQASLDEAARTREAIHADTIKQARADADALVAALTRSTDALTRATAVLEAIEEKMDREADSTQSNRRRK